ncbi:MAG: hypothetical protein OHK0047_21900 [Leptolyngbyaceae cyanobacterium]
MKHLVLIGRGHPHAVTLQMFGMKPLPGVRLSLISEASDRSAYSGMIPMWQVFAVEQPVTLIYGH